MTLTTQAFRSHEEIIMLEVIHQYILFISYIKMNSFTYTMDIAFVYGIFFLLKKCSVLA